jgi:hypothetical protein
MDTVDNARAGSRDRCRISIVIWGVLRIVAGSSDCVMVRLSRLNDIVVRKHKPKTETLSESVRMARKVKQMKSISAILCAVVLLGSMAAVRAETCCEKAKAAGKDCEHKCCVKAKKEGKTCEKCNPPKK